MQMEQIQLKHQTSILDVIAALRRLNEALDRFAVKSGFDPSQPRVPAGNSDGGQWTDGSGGNGSSTGSSTSNTSRSTGNFAALTDKPTASGRGPKNPANLLEIAETILSMTPHGRGWRFIAQTLRIGGQLAQPLAKLAFGGHKSAKRWANQIRKREWDLDEITETTSRGKKFPAPNNVNPGNTATRYENPRTGKYIVRDDKTGDILQLGRRDFDRPPTPGKKHSTEWRS
jgi:hypothetical protein